MPSPTPIRPLVLISSLAPGGAERVTVSCLRRMADGGRRVPLCTVSSHGDTRLAQVLDLARVFRHDLGATRLADPAALMRLVGILRKWEYNLVHAHGQDASVLAAAACRLLGIPLVITRHVLSEPQENWRQRVRASATVRALRSAKALIAVSNATATALRRTKGISGARVRVIFNGVELERFLAASRSGERNKVRAELGIEPDDPVVLVPAVLRQGKGHEAILSVVPQLRAQIPRVRLLFAGAGPMEETLRDRAQPHGDAIVFLGNRNDIPALMEAADLVALASSSEALPTVLIEAAAAGRAVVSTRVGGVEEVVQHEQTGLLVPPYHTESLAAAIMNLLQDSARARALGEAAQARARQHFSIDAQVRHTWTLWEDVVRGAAA